MQPKELTVHKDKITETTITVSWREPNPSDVPIVGYEVEYRKSGEEFKKVEKSLTNEDFTCEVTGLAAHTEYEFRVAAINAAGYGAFTDVVTHFTSESCVYFMTGSARQVLSAHRFFDFEHTYVTHSVGKLYLTQPRLTIVRTKCDRACENQPCSRPKIA